MTRGLRLAAAALGAAALLGAAAGCTGSSAPSGSGTGASGSSGPNGSTSSAAPSAGSSGPTAPGDTSPAPAPCPAGALAVTVTDVPGASGTSYARITVENTSDLRCAVSGYPQARLLGPDRAPLGEPAEPIAETPDVIALAPGERASTLLQDATSQCNELNASFLEVTPPGSDEATVVASELPPCALRLRPLTAGDEPRP